MFRFQHPEWLLALSGIIGLIAIFIISDFRKKRLLSKFGELDLIQNLLDKFIPQRRLIKRILIIVIYTFIVLALANPQIGTKL